MTSPIVPSTAVDSRAADASGGRWLLVLRAAWATVSVLAAVLFVVAMPVTFARLQQICTGSACEPWELTPERAAALHESGISIPLHAGYLVALEAMHVAIFASVAALIVRRRPRDPLALIVALTLLTFGFGGTASISVAGEGRPLLWLIAMSLRYTGQVLLSALLFVFPSGRFVPRWTRWLVLAWAILDFPGVFFPGSPLSFQNWAQPLALAIWLLFLGSGIGAQIYRYRRVSSPAERQQTKWALFGIVAGLIGFFSMIVLVTVYPWLDQPGSWLSMLVGLGFYGSKSLIPLGIGVAVLRYRLWEIDPIINRTLVYAGLTASVIAIYVFVVVYLGALFRTSGNLAISLIATGVVAVVFQPLRERLQRSVNRLMYGERDDPYAVLSRLGQRLESTLAPDAVLQTIVETVRESLKLPYVAIRLSTDESMVGRPSSVVIDAGTAMPDLVTIPLTYQHEPVGQLLLAPRAAGESFSPTDRRLLDDLARQAGVAVHAVRLTLDLQRSRERLITTREEERRRLRRDLHDGLGPQLAALNLQAGVLRTVIPRDPAAADQQVVELRSEIRAAIASIRRLVYDLRPPTLDELGLVGAIREQAAKYAPTGLTIAIDAPDSLPPLSAAVEVAAYRIAQEALTNAVRHARAASCTVRLKFADSWLIVEIMDDGVGIADDARSGVGLHSMRERAEELGGSFRLESSPGGGTRLMARLPVR